MTGSNSPGAKIRYKYFMTSAKRKLSWLSSFIPPSGELTSPMAEKPEDVRVVALIATNASHAQSRYYRRAGCLGDIFMRLMGEHTFSSPVARKA